MTSEDTLSLVLETISVVLQVDQGKWLTAELTESLVSAVIEVWHKINKGEQALGGPFKIFDAQESIRSNFYLYLNGYPLKSRLFPYPKDLRDSREEGLAHINSCNYFSKQGGIVDRKFGD